MSLDFIPINANYAQDAATNIRRLIITAEHIISTISATSENQINAIEHIDINPEVVNTIEVIQNIYQKPDTLYIIQPLPIIVPGTNVNYIKNYIKPEPIVKNLTNIAAYQRVCSDAYSNDSRYIECRKCVDRWLDDHKDGFFLKDLTSTGTGCKVK